MYCIISYRNPVLRTGFLYEKIQYYVLDFCGFLYEHYETDAHASVSRSTVSRSTGNPVLRTGFQNMTTNKYITIQ